MDASKPTTQPHSFVETFDNGLGSFWHIWGDVKAANNPADGYIEVRSPASTHENASAMIQPSGPSAGFGYGLYSFTMDTDSSIVGPYALLWPATDRWPGPEINVFEIGGSPGATLGKPYSALHWRTPEGEDRSQWYLMPDGIDPRDVHTYSVNWQPDAITYAVDGNAYQTVTNLGLIPKDYAHGGENLVPSFGQLTGHWQDQNTVDNVARLYEFSYSPF